MKTLGTFFTVYLISSNMDRRVTWSNILSSNFAHQTLKKKTSNNSKNKKQETDYNLQHVIHFLNI